MRYQIQWFPIDIDKYNERLFLKAVQEQPDAKNVVSVPYENRYSPGGKSSRSTAIEFSVDGGYPIAEIVKNGVNNYLMRKLRTSNPQGFSIRSIPSTERKSKSKITNIKRIKCRCKK
jgi:hypothetical protein